MSKYKMVLHFISLLSDIHLESMNACKINRFISSLRKSTRKINNKISTDKFNDDEYKNIMILAGDIGYPGTEKYRTFLLTISKIFDYVFVIAGNHEYYVGHNFESTESMIKKDCMESKCIYLQNRNFILDDIQYVGCTLWSLLSERARHISKFELADFNNISEMTIEKRDYLFYRDLNYIESSVSNYNGLSVVITHHSGNKKMDHVNYHNHINATAYVTDIDALETDINQVESLIWINGHTHYSKYYKEGDNIYWSNCYGYSHKEEKTYYNITSRLVIDSISHSKHFCRY